MANTTASRMAGSSFESSPSGMCVTITSASEMPPATERSIPPCCTTSIWPSPAMASTAATGSMPDSDVGDTLAGWNTALMTKSRTVAVPIVARPFETETRPRAMRRVSCCAASAMVSPCQVRVSLATVSRVTRVERDCTERARVFTRGCWHFPKSAGPV